MTALTGYILLFVIVAAGFVLIHLLLGKLIRPNKPDPEKQSIYECGEPTIGSSWVQFDLRYYVIALLFVIFDVEVAFFFPWAVVFGKAQQLSNPELAIDQRVELSAQLDPNAPPNPSYPPETVARQADVAGTIAWVSFLDLLVFFGVLLVGFAYLWSRGDLNWVRSTAAEQRVEQQTAAQPPPASRPPLVEVG